MGSLGKIQVHPQDYRIWHASTSKPAKVSCLVKASMASTKSGSRSSQPGRAKGYGKRQADRAYTVQDTCLVGL